MKSSRVALALAVLGTSLTATPALGLTLEVTHAGPSVVGEAHGFTATATEASGAVTFSWTFGESAEPEAGGPAALCHNPLRTRLQPIPLPPTSLLPDVVVLAAGKGTRMLSARPKVLHPLAGRPLLGHVLQTVRSLSAQRIVVVSRSGAVRMAARAVALASGIELLVVERRHEATPFLTLGK